MVFTASKHLKRRKSADLIVISRTVFDCSIPTTRMFRAFRESRHKSDDLIYYFGIYSQGNWLG